MTPQATLHTNDPRDDCGPPPYQVRPTQYQQPVAETDLERAGHVVVARVLDIYRPLAVLLRVANDAIAGNDVSAGRLRKAASQIPCPQQLDWLMGSCREILEVLES